MTINRQLEARMRQATRFFYMLKDPLRFRILLALVRAGEMTVTDVVRAVRVSQPLVSWHLGRLRLTGLVRARRDGREVRYSADMDVIDRHCDDFRALLAEAAQDAQAKKAVSLPNSKQ